MKILLVLTLVLVGCGGESFSGELFTAPDGGTGTGGSVATGGAVGTGGETSTGGAASTGGGTETGGEPSTGGMVGTGGVVATGGTSATGGVTSTGGMTFTGGTPATGGATSTGGAPATGGLAGTGGSTCALVTHSDGLGQTWQDCVPLGTHDNVQATKACEAWCAANVCFCATTVTCSVTLVGGDAGGGWKGWVDNGSVVSASFSTSSSCTIVGTWN